MINTRILSNNETNIFPKNNAVQIFKLGRRVQDSYIVKLINACQAPTLIQFENRIFLNPSQINWNELDRRLDTVRFINCKLSLFYIIFFDYVKLIRQAEFIFNNNNSGNANDIRGELKFYKFNNYMIIPSADNNSTNFSLKLK
ncbi:hypothetical protein CONCODRAFT_9983 [Conidiobolus coronatus NRRL 28638]|uniref:Uncharacterized protein n=1 Tax=Conidiobolus coronatus (strain ATCC 28846 / CBS 209.66 / NRRL 28638) TaxID=796925 RepID=A0A137NYD8_CONC2|nr:hypothetical protein CONCODRAFT_9983 [Conidiobolus coronatus NRRL 28638]|eukprot:KXN67883.1 hypothetical protein CONCODRAFT_9983 [Conidiobolus coronatus NRRL 28638]